MQVPLVDLVAQYQTIRHEIAPTIQRVLETANFILGAEVATFETLFATYLGAAGTVGVASGTAALHLALRACAVGQGDEVICPALTFAATAEAVFHVGARPVFVDVDPRTYNLEPTQVEDAVTSRTRAIIPVHIYGQPAEMDAIMDIARRHNLRVIEDAAQAHGAEYRRRLCGTIGDLGCFSFYPGKNLGAYGDAGAVAGNDQALLHRVRSLRNHGRTGKYQHEEIGYCERLDTLQAAILAVKLTHLADWTAARRRSAQLYNEKLGALDVDTPFESPAVRHCYHLYVVRSGRRDALAAFLSSRGIATGVHYPQPLHRQRAFADRGYGSLSLPVSERVSQEVLSLPMFPELTESQICYIVAQIEEFFR